MLFWKYLQGQTREVRKGGSRVAARKVRTGVRWLLDFLIGLPIVAGMWLLSPLIRIRFNPLDSYRLGHFVLSPDEYLCARDAGLNFPSCRHLDIAFFTTRIVPNIQVAKMWSRIFRIGPSWLLRRAYRVSHFLPGSARRDASTYALPPPPSYKATYLFQTMPPYLRLTDDEESRGQEGLRAMGIPDGHQFICLHNRDASYMPTVDCDVDETRSDYRNATIESYQLAAEALAGRGYFVVRMGAVVASPLRSSSPYVINYATSGFRSDFMDVYLVSKCFFFLGSNSGLENLAHALRRPVAIVNHAPVGSFISSCAMLVLAKQYFLLSEKRYLSLREIVARNVQYFFLSHEYDKFGLRLVENTPEEIRDLGVEMVERLTGAWHAHPMDEGLQQRVIHACVQAKDEAVRRYRYNPFPARYSANFLRANPSWLD